MSTATANQDTPKIGTSNSGKEKPKSNVKITWYKIVDDTSTTANDWPLGEEILSMISSSDVVVQAGMTDDQKGNAEYWQVQARYALIQKYHPSLVTSEGSLSPTKWKYIHQVWKDHVVSESDNELSDWIHSCRSNQRKLQWAVMNIAAGCQFRLHAHPNIELIYCIQGALHEVRLSGDPITTDFPLNPIVEMDKTKQPSTNQQEQNTKVSNPSVQGPNLSKIGERIWVFDTLSEGNWLVNEVGSIHKSFTSTNGSGCTLLVLWGGSHANIEMSPENKHVLEPLQTAVSQMDQQLLDDTVPGCGCQQEWESIRETFLPESERGRTKDQ